MSATVLSATTTASSCRAAVVSAATGIGEPLVLAHAPRRSPDVEHHRSVQQAVQDGAGHHVVAKGGAPSTYLGRPRFVVTSVGTPLP
jgi:hypothetical protein